jgi:hypothetical protein
VIGRLGFTDGALPAIMPVVFALHGERVVIPAKRASGVVAAVRGAVVAFQTDSYSLDTHAGWSVTVVGPSRVVSAPDEVAAFDLLELPARPSAAQRCYIAVRMDLVRGWRMTPGDDGGPPTGGVGAIPLAM